MNNRKNHIYALRLVFIIAIAVLVWLLIQGRFDYALVLIFFLACGSIINVTTSEIDKGLIVICRHFLYGMLRSKTYVRLEEITGIIPVNIELSDNTPSSSDDLVAILSSSFNTASINLYQVNWKDKEGVMRSIKISEQQYLQLSNSLQNHSKFKAGKRA